MTQPAQVAICVPSGRQWEADMAIRMVGIVSRATSNGVRTLTINEKNSLIALSRNSMAKNALDMGATHIFWCDTDNTPPIDVIKRFLDHDKDIVGSVYCKRVPPYELLGVPAEPVDASKGGVVPYWLMPGGCIMVSARVYRTIPQPWYFDSIRREGGPIEHFVELLKDHYHLQPPESLIKSLTEDDELLQWLRAEEEENRTRFWDNKNMGEDYNFCLKAQRYGFQPWCDVDASFDTGHIGEQVVMLSKPDKTKNSLEPL